MSGSISSTRIVLRWVTFLKLTLLALVSKKKKMCRRECSCKIDNVNNLKNAINNQTGENLTSVWWIFGFSFLPHVLMLLGLLSSCRTDQFSRFWCPAAGAWLCYSWHEGALLMSGFGSWTDILLLCANWRFRVETWEWLLTKIRKSSWRMFFKWYFLSQMWCGLCDLESWVR